MSILIYIQVATENTINFDVSDNPDPTPYEA